MSISTKAIIGRSILFIVWIAPLIYGFLPLLLPTAVDWNDSLKGGALILAFVIGIYPRVGVQVLVHSVTSRIKELKTPEDILSDALTSLDGLNAWHEARLLEEKVETIQNLATAPLDELIVHTNYSPDQLFDWVDQAILHLYAGERLRVALKACCIRTATGFLINTCKTDAGKYDYDSGATKKFAMALNAVQASSVTNNKSSAGAAGTNGDDKTDDKQSSPSDIKEEVLHTIANSMRACPNTDKLWRFWQKTKPGSEIVAADKKQKVESAQSIPKALLRRQLERTTRRK